MNKALPIIKARYHLVGELFNFHLHGDFRYSAYLLNGQYTKLVGTIAPSSEFSKGAPDPNIVRLQIFGDGRLIYDSQSVASDIMKPIQVSGDDQTDGQLGFVNAELIK